MESFSGKKNKIFILVATSIFMSTLDSSIVNIALPYIMKDFGTGVKMIQWVVIIYLLTVSSFLLFFGRLSDIRGRRQLYCSGFLVFTLGSLLCSLAATPVFLVISRAVQGFGASMLMACSPALIVDVFPPRERGKALGMIGAVVASGLTAGPMAGGILLDLFSWRAIFFINIPIGLAATLAGSALLKNTPADRGTREPMDIMGSIWMGVCLISLISAMTHLDQWGVTSVNFILLTTVCIGSAAGFMVTEATAAHPLFDPGLIRIRLFAFPVISSAFLFCALFIIIFMMPFYLVHVGGYSASVTGFVMTTPFAFLLLVAPVSGMLYDRIGSVRLCAAGMLAIIISLVSLAGLSPDMPIFSIVWRLSLAGLGTALFTSPNNTAAMNSVPRQRRGVASGAVATSRNLGMVVGVSLAGLIFSSSFASLTGNADLENFTVDMIPFFMVSFKRTIITGAIISLVNFFLVFFRGKETAGRD